MRGPVVQSLNVRQMNLRRSGTPCEHVGRQLGIRERDPPEARRSRSGRGATACCADVRQPLLQVAVGRARRTPRSGSPP